jgi:HAD superfamily hydrolase (TIGR01509 family)
MFHTQYQEAGIPRLRIGLGNELELAGFPRARHPDGMSFSAVLFDFDGVLVDTEWAIYQAWLRTFQAHGHDLPLEVYTRCIGSDFATWSPKTHLEEISGLAFDWHDLDARRQQEIMRDLSGEGTMPGVIDLLEQLTRAGIRRAVVSSSSHHWVDGWLEKLAFSNYFESVVCRGDAPQIKPAPDLYLEAAKRLGLPSAECLVIEDSLNGMTAAKAAGMTVWIVPNPVTAGLDFSAADRVFPSLGELAGELRK